MLERLPPQGAVQKLNERVKKIGKTNSEIADWLQERRKVEDQYVAGLRKLARKPLQETGQDLGIFDGPWRKIVAAIEDIAQSHALLSERIEKDVELPLRTFATNNREMSAMTTIQGNLASMARELDDAQEKSDKLNRKGGKASSLKVDAASSKLSTATSQWDSQAPFIYETLQALDERRLNHLRDVLTQYETHEADVIEQNRRTVEQTLSALLEVDTAQEIKNWSQATIAGKPFNERRTRQLSTAGSGSGGTSSLAPPQTPRSNTDNHSEHSGPNEKGESKISRRFGTMLGKRRQSMVGTFGRNPSPNKGFQPFGQGRSSGSRDGPSPQASMGNLNDSPSRDNRLSSLAESPPLQSPTSQANGNPGVVNSDSAFIADAVATGPPSRATNGTTGAALFGDLSDVQPPPGPPPSHLKPASEAQKDSEGYTIPASMNDPISQAEHDAAQENEQQQFKLDIRKEPIPEQDADAQAALSNVANTLRSSHLATPSRKAGTVRGRRDVRNTMYVPPSNSLDVSTSENMPPPSPGIATGRAAALAALSSNDRSNTTGSDTTSIRSGHSLANHTVAKHADLHQPGLNASIIETVSATLENGEIKTAKINGEIALAYNKAEAEDSSTEGTIRINNFPNLEAIGPNRTFIHPVIGDKPDEFTVDLATISKPAVAFTYRVHIDDEAASAKGPLLLKVAWRRQGDKLELRADYSLNPVYSAEPVTLHGLVLVAFYEGSKAIGCQTRPSGTHIKEKSLAYWRIGDVTLKNESSTVICRFLGAEGACPEPGHLEARWEIHGSAASGISLSRLEPSQGKEKEEDDPFADESIASPTTVSPVGNWVEVATHKKFVSGKYEATGPFVQV